MTELRFDLEWERVGGSRGDELAATWARLAIRVGTASITRVNDYRSRALRDHILIPLYPLAEWIAAHWWSLLYEVQAPGRDGYEYRHNLQYGREGFALPDLLIEPTGEHALIEWRALDLPDAQIGFPTSGACDLDLGVVRNTLADLIETVLARLDQEGVGHTSLHEEWLAIQAADDAEADFCRAAGRLGQDPYALSDPAADAIVAAASRVPAQWQNDFFDIADAGLLTAQAALIEDARAHLQCSPVRIAAIPGLRQDISEVERERTPWNQGYRAARMVRQALGLGARPLNSDGDLADALGMPILPGANFPDPAARRLFDAMLEGPDGEPAAFLTTKTRPEQVRFAFCRGWFECLTATGAPSALMTVARTDRQKRNRAFAAEFLAPADWLRERIGGTWVTPDEVDEWAEELGVSADVVGRQIENHRLAAMAGGY
jgi:hypothetical protein